MNSVQVEQVKQQNIMIYENFNPISVWTSRSRTNSPYARD